MSLRTALATPEDKRRYVRQLFATIADRYDLITVLLSYGLDRRWKRRLVRLARIRPDDRALDLACGTGDIALALCADGAKVTGLDLTYRMVDLARAKPVPSAPAAGRDVPRSAFSILRSPFSVLPSPRLPRFLVGDMMALPFPDRSFDLVTTGYGIRNVPDIAGALTEIHRVLEPGGRLLSLDFNRPSHPLVRALYLAYLHAVGSALGLVLHRDPDTYRYIPASIRRHPGAGGVSRLMRESGFVGVEHTRVLGGLMAIHCGSKGKRREG